MQIKKIAVTKAMRIYPVEDLNRSIHLAEGAIDRQILIDHNHDGLIATTTGEELLFCDATFKDNIDRMKRKAAIIIPKDIGFLIADVGLTKDSIVLEAGSGSGSATCQLAAVCKKVYSYDIHPDHVKVTRENCVRMDFDNVICEEQDITTLEPIEQVDFVLIDMPDPVLAIPTIHKALKQGGFVAFYTPHINQAQAVVAALGDDFKFLTTLELIQRRWEVNDKQLRPKHAMLGHTAFLTIARIFRR